MSSEEISEWKVFFQLEAADMNPGGGSGKDKPMQIQTASGKHTVE